MTGKLWVRDVGEVVLQIPRTADGRTRVCVVALQFRTEILYRLVPPSLFHLTYVVFCVQLWVFGFEIPESVGVRCDVALKGRVAVAKD